MFDIITFGSATRDILLKPKKISLLQYRKESDSPANICFPVGSKIDIEDMAFSVGGGGTNTAATFANQGFKTAFCGMIGKDLSGLEIINELKHCNIDARLVLFTAAKPTSHSVIISGNGSDRTILTYRGTSELLGREQIPWKKLKAKWLYLAPLSGLLCDIFAEIAAFADEHHISIAANPGIAQLSLPKAQLTEIFSKISILILNQEEASFLTKIPYGQEKEIFRAIDGICPNVVIMTKGGEGVSVSDGKYLYSAKPFPNRRVADTTGAGDAFGSGFVSEFIRSRGDIEKTIQFAMANSQACLEEVGAKKGLLKKDQQFEKVQVAKEMCDNNICVRK